MVERTSSRRSLKMLRGNGDIVMLLENNPYPTDVRVRNEAESLRRAGYRVKVVAPRAPGQPSREFVGGVAVSRFPLPPERQTFTGFALEYAIATIQLYVRAAAALAKGASVLHLHNPPDTLFGIGLLARSLGRKVVFDHHDLAPELFAVKFGRSRMVAVLRAMERATFRVSNVVVASNESHRQVAIDRGKVPPERVVIVRNGPRRATLLACSPPRHGALDDPHLLFLGELEPQDGVDTLPGLLAKLDERGLHRARMTVVGDGSCRRGLEREFARVGLADRVAFTGRVPHRAVPKLLAAADICVDVAGCNDLNHRSTMVKIAEYLAAGRPVVTHRLVETERTAGDAAVYAGCGNLAQFAEQVVRLARNPGLRAELARRGRQRAAELVWERSEGALLEAYARL